MLFGFSKLTNHISHHMVIYKDDSAQPLHFYTGATLCLCNFSLFVPMVSKVTPLQKISHLL